MYQVRYGVFAPAPIKWLLASESDVLACVQRFAGNAADDVVTVAGPPDRLEVRRAKRAGETPQLPTVTIHMRKARHSATGALYVEVACSDDDLAMIESWRLRTLN